ncbi:DUF5134 domain-containing protein [Micromonospora endophytica]|nr:DUF5134 domain-containing protein [Micromonospora endophytica]
MTFALIAVLPYFAARLVRPVTGRPGARIRPRLCDVAHLLMAVGMTTMVWTVRVPAVVWVVVFAPIAVWLAVLAARAPGRLPHGSRAVTAYFAVSMAAMVWMAVPTGHHDPVAGSHHGSSPAAFSFTPLVSLVLGGYLLLTAGWWIGRDMRLTPLWQEPSDAAGPAPRTGARAESICHATMGAVMGLMLLTMV